MREGGEAMEKGDMGWIDGVDGHSQVGLTAEASDGGGGGGGGFLMGLIVGDLRSSKEEEEVDNLRRLQGEKEVGNHRHRRRREREKTLTLMLTEVFIKSLPWIGDYLKH